MSRVGHRVLGPADADRRGAAHGRQRRRGVAGRLESGRARDGAEHPLRRAAWARPMLFNTRVGIERYQLRVAAGGHAAQQPVVEVLHRPSNAAGLSPRLLRAASDGSYRRQRAMERRAAVGVVLGLDRSAVGGHDRAADRQAKAQALFAERHERLEHPLELPLGNAAGPRSATASWTKPSRRPSSRGGGGRWRAWRSSRRTRSARDSARPAAAGRDRPHAGNRGRPGVLFTVTRRDMSSPYREIDRLSRRRR